MIKKYGAFGLFAIVCGLLLMLSQCGKETNPAPKIVFEKPASAVYFLSQDTTLYRGTIYNVQVRADRTGPDGFLKTFKILRAINGGNDSALLNAEINTLLFRQAYSFQAGDSGNIERYTFTVGNGEGLTTSVAYNITVR